MNNEITKTYEENVENLKEKLQRGDFSLTPTDFYLLKNEESVLALFRDLVAQKKVDWHQLWEDMAKLNASYSASEINFNSFISFVFNGDERAIDPELMFLMLRWDTINKGDYDFSDYEQSNLPLSPEMNQLLMEDAYQRLISVAKTNQTIYLSNSLIQRLLEEEKYEIFTLDCVLPGNVDVEYILSKFPYHQYHSDCINNLLVKYYSSQRNDIAAIIDSGLADRLPTQTVLSIAGESSNISPQHVSYLVNQILAESNLNDLDINLIFNYFSEEQKSQVIAYLKNMGRFDLIFCGNTVTVEKDSEDYKFILSSMQNGVKFRNFPDNIDDLSQDATFLEAIVVSGSIDNLYDKLTDGTKLRIVQRIFQEIANGNKNYINGIYNIEEYISDIELLKSVDFDFHNELFFNHVLEIESMDSKEKIMNLILIKNPLLAENLINKGQYDLFFKIFRLPKPCFSSLEVFGQLSESSQKQLVEAIQQNYTYLECISEEFGENKPIWRNPILLEALLNFPTSRKKIFEVLNSEENHPQFDKVYEVFKEYFVETKGYNATHLDALKDRFGLEIIKYLEEENIATILRYDDDKFNRLMDLFSQQKMTFDQLRDAYDSIIQYRFPREHSDAINIFNQIMSFLQKKEKQLSANKLIENQLLPLLDFKFYYEFKATNPEEAKKYLNIFPSLFPFLEDCLKNKLLQHKEYSDLLKLLETKFPKKYSAFLRELEKESPEKYKELSDLLTNEKYNEFFQALETNFPKEFKGLLELLKDRFPKEYLEVEETKLLPKKYSDFLKGLEKESPEKYKELSDLLKNEKYGEFLQVLKMKFPEKYMEFLETAFPEKYSEFLQVIEDSKIPEKNKDSIEAELKKMYSNLLAVIVEKITTNAIDSQHYKDMLHLMTDYYIKVERENYRAEHDINRMASDLKLLYHIDANDAKRKLPKFLVEKKFIKGN